MAGLVNGNYKYDTCEFVYPLFLISFQGTFLLATWRGIEVAVKMFGEDVMTDEDKVWVGPILSTELYVCSNYNVFLVRMCTFLTSK